MQRPILSLLTLTLCSAVALTACGDNAADVPPGGGGQSSGDSGGGGDTGGGAGDSNSPIGLPCDYGDDSSKCAASPELACAPPMTATGAACSSDKDCTGLALCFEAASSDSSEGECLNLAGECTLVTPNEEGTGFGQTCALDDDECAGTCVDVGRADGTGECEEYCRVGATSGCGYHDMTQEGVACAFFAYDLADVDVTQGAGDMGICATLCDCNDDCPDGQLCLNNPVDGYAGICAGGINQAESITNCPSGLGGAGGAGNL